METAFPSDQLHAFAQLSNVKQHVFQRHCTQFERVSNFKASSTKNSVKVWSLLTRRSFIHKVQFIVEVGQFWVLLLHNKCDVVEQSHFPVCGLCVQQLHSKQYIEYIISKKNKKYKAMCCWLDFAYLKLTRSRLCSLKP